MRSNKNKQTLSTVAYLKYHPLFARVQRGAIMTAGLYRPGLEQGIFKIKLRSLTAQLPCILKHH
jgi:hypothetical protein